MQLPAANGATMQTKPVTRINIRLGHRVLFASVLAGLLAGLTVQMCVAQEGMERVRIEADLVDLKVSVLAHDSQKLPAALSKEDFKVFEDGVEQDISFFASSTTPFDLVLLLDLSGSTAKKLKMIKSSARKFIEKVRPTDRVAIVVFTDRPALLSNFTLDRELLKDRLDHIKSAFGGTNFWDAMNYVLDRVVSDQSSLRRSAIVVMSDGVDNALEGVPGPGSQISFEQLLGKLQSSETIVFPIYLDTEEEDVKRYHLPRSAYTEARNQLGEIATSSGTPLYKATKLKDLDLLYDRVLNDLSTIYSIGYRPQQRSVKEGWHSIRVQVPTNPELTVRTRKGYFTRFTAER